MSPPKRLNPIRFAVIDKKGMSSNAWRVWATPSTDIYVACRDNFKEVKVSLHVAGGWRFGFTAEESDKRGIPRIDRTWETWSPPAADSNGVIQAFRLYLLNSELAVHYSMRKPNEWKAVRLLDAPTGGDATTVTIFITETGRPLVHESGVSETLLFQQLSDTKWLQVVTAHDPALPRHATLEAGRAAIVKRARERGEALPANGYLYLYGHDSDEVRFILPARVLDISSFGASAS